MAARLTGVMLLVLVMASPVASLDSHAVSHWTSPADATQHHHHDEDGRIIADHDHDQGSTSENAEDELPPGHAHMPAQVVGLDAPDLPQAVALIHVRSDARLAPSAVHPPPDEGPNPHNRPPRLA